MTQNDMEEVIKLILEKSDLPQLLRWERIMDGAIALVSPLAAPNASLILDRIRDEISKKT